MPYPVIPDVPAAPFAQLYPSASTPEVISSGVKAAAVASAAIPASTSGQTSYLTGFEIVGSGATAASVVVVTVTDGTWTLSYPVAVVAGATLQNPALVVRFNPPLKASAANTAITVSCPSLGSGNTNNVVNAEGFQL